MDFSWKSTGASIHSNNPTDHGNNNTTATENSGTVSLAAQASPPLATRIDPHTGWILQGMDDEDAPNSDWLEVTIDPALLLQADTPRINPTP